ncbi:hypothetical protein lerEdw1_006463 [Lerista edwardsae]|nr:hypothetical protein lerEdw1_006463 [Lerista edwardsae]
MATVDGELRGDDLSPRSPRVSGGHSLGRRRRLDADGLPAGAPQPRAGLSASAAGPRRARPSSAGLRGQGGHAPRLASPAAPAPAPQSPRAFGRLALTPAPRWPGGGRPGTPPGSPVAEGCPRAPPRRASQPPRAPLASMSGGKKKSGFQITSVTSDGKVARGAAEEEEDGQQASGGTAVPRNGPSAPSSPPGAAPSPQGSVSAATASRFRVVKLDQGSGEPYRRGRWTCRDFYEPELEQHLPGRLGDSARHPQSLDSRLEVAGLLARPQSPFSPQPQRRGAFLHRTPASPAVLRSPQATAEALLLPPAPCDGAKDPADPPSPGSIPTLVVEEHLLPKGVAQLIQREAEERRKVLPRETRSRPSSPAPPLFRDASPGRRTSDPFGTSRFSLARSMFGMGIAHDSEDDR